MSEPIHSQEPERGSRWKIIILVLVTAFLAYTAFPRLDTGMVSTPKAQASTMCNQLAIACQLFKDEYGVYPSTTENYRLYIILNGRAATRDNPRYIQFMSFNKKDLSPNGEIIDPWGTPYRIVIDDKGPLVTSAGKDKLFGTQDDITNR